GDSLACGVAGKADSACRVDGAAADVKGALFNGPTRIGAGPVQIQSNITADIAKNPGRYKNSQALVSDGCTNNGAQCTYAIVSGHWQTLADAGVTRIGVIGIDPAIKLPSGQFGNAALQEYVGQFAAGHQQVQIVFLNPFALGVKFTAQHPTDYQ